MAILELVRPFDHICSENYVMASRTVYELSR